MNRIDLIASLCKSSEVICDIGCDHAQVIVKAIKNYGVKYGYACDKCYISHVVPSKKWKESKYNKYGKRQQ